MFGMDRIFEVNHCDVGLSKIFVGDEIRPELTRYTGSGKIVLHIIAKLGLRVDRDAGGICNPANSDARSSASNIAAYPPELRPKKQKER